MRWTPEELERRVAEADRQIRLIRQATRELERARAELMAARKKARDAHRPG